MLTSSIRFLCLCVFLGLFEGGQEQGGEAKKGRGKRGKRMGEGETKVKEERMGEKMKLEMEMGFKWNTRGFETLLWKSSG
jgi:hypothetical protein